MTTSVPVPTQPACVSRLRIAGFKSFADPVALDILPGLIDLVGPNGCGKSNVVDAPRWAMGEGNARTLRGASPQAVSRRTTYRCWRSGRR